ncbi:MAG: carboxynorspermidine decarboxylase [Kiritimatiellia bacterium]
MKLPISKSVLRQIRTPAYVIDKARLEDNLGVLSDIRDRTGCSILLALKAFAVFPLFPLMRSYLDGVSASSMHEVKLGAEEFQKEIHLCAPAYSDEDFPELLRLCNHIVFNSFSQRDRFRSLCEKDSKGTGFGIRINPGHSEVKTALYDPCRRHSRLGVPADELQKNSLDLITGMHFHSLCELNADALERTLEAVESNFGRYLEAMDWINFGGGHHITRQDYDRDLLCRLIDRVSKRYGARVYLEPGEAVALNAGVLTASVLDITRNEKEIAILDTSASAHMPDVLEMPYRPEIAGAGRPGQYQYTYILGGASCLAGDVIGEYSFPEPLSVGDRLCFMDMAHYTVVKNTTFNGLRLPSIVIYDSRSETVESVREFGYEDYRGRLG